MQNDPDSALGVVVPIQNACSDVASTPRQNVCPQNGEWQGVNAGSCQYDSLSNGCACTTGGCSAGHCAIAGAQTGCKRINYSADRVKCCLNKLGAPTIGTQTCDPRYRGPTASGCRDVLINHCDNPANFFSAQCREWIATQNQIRNDISTKQCANSTDPWCACFTSKVPPEWVGDATKIALLRCLDPKCEGGNNPAALKPYNLVCPTSYVDCQQKDIQLKLIESGISQATVQNKCGNIDLGGSPPGAPAPSSSPAPAPTPAPAPAGMSKTTLGLIGGGIGLLLIIAIIIVAMTMMKKKPGVAVK